MRARRVPRLDADSGALAKLSPVGVILAGPLMIDTDQRKVLRDVDTGVKVVIDPERITQAVLNILDNALKVSSPEGHIRVVGREIAGRAEIRVTDEGQGATFTIDLPIDAVGARTEAT